MSTDKLIVNLTYLLAFCLPLYIFGINIEKYPINLPTTILLFLNILLLLRRKVQINIFFPAILFIFLVLFTVIGKYPVKEYLFSILALLLMLIPFFCSYPDGVSKKKLLNFLVTGAIFSYFFVVYELITHYYELTLIENIFSIGIKPVVINQVYFGIYRVKSTMYEPSHYAAYLSFVYIILDIANSKGLVLKKQLLFKRVYIIVLMLTFSLTGIVLILVYFLLKYMWKLGYFVKKPIIVVNNKLAYRILFFLFILFALLFINTNLINNNNIYTVIQARANKTYSSFINEDHTQSEGYRANSFRLLLDYWNNNNIQNILMGEGYSNYNNWLIENYSNIHGYRDGVATNLFLILGISTGVMGILFYLLLLYTIFFDHKYPLPIIFFIVYLLFNFTHGYLIISWTWVPILIARLINKRSIKTVQLIHNSG